jgi:hypothetical protein
MINKPLERKKERRSDVLCTMTSKNREMTMMNLRSVSSFSITQDHHDTCIYVHHFSIFHVHIYKCTYDCLGLSLDKQIPSIFRCTFVLTFNAHNWRLAIVITYKRRERIFKYKEQFALLVRSCYATNGWSQSLFAVVMSLLLIIHSTHTSCDLTEVNIHNVNRGCVCKRVFIEVTEDESSVVIFSLNQTQSVVQHVNERWFIEDSRQEKRIANIKSIFLLVTSHYNKDGLNEQDDLSLCVFFFFFLRLFSDM